MKKSHHIAVIRNTTSSTALKITVIAAAAAALISCGGGGGGASGSSSASTTPGTSVVPSSTSGSGLGFITGFGSVIVDGVTYADSDLDSAGAISVETDSPTASTGTRDAVKIGQHVEIVFTPGSTSNLAKSLVVSSEVVGLVTQVANPAVNSGNEITVAGQRVVTNTDPTAGPITILDGASNLAALTTSDRLEVHGVFKTDGNGSYILASRLEVKPQQTTTGSAITLTKITGAISNLTSAAGTSSFTIGGVMVTVPPSAVIAPAGAILSNGAKVKVFSTGNVSGGALTASAVKVKTITTSVDTFRVFGAVTSLDTVAKTFKVDDVLVDGSGLSALPVNGQSVRVSGTYNVTTKTLKAVELKVADAQVTTSDIKGSVTDFVSLSDFKVRGTPIDASAATVTGGSIAQNVFVAVKGVIQNGVVKASTIEVKTPETDAQIVQSGPLSQINTATKTFVVDGKAAAFDSTTEFVNGTLQNLANTTQVRVEGRLVNGVIQVRKLEFKTASNDYKTTGVLRANPTLSGNTLSFKIGDLSVSCATTVTGCSTSNLKAGNAVDVRFVISNLKAVVTRIETVNQ